MKLTFCINACFDGPIRGSLRYYIKLLYYYSGKVSMASFPLTLDIAQGIVFILKFPRILLDHFSQVSRK